MTLEQLRQFVSERGERTFRGGQLFSWIYARGARCFAEMTDISKDFRSILEESAEIGALELLQSARSHTSSASKLLFGCRDGARIESVYIMEGGRRTLCVSSQVGCALGCTFCATATLGFVRNLSVAEIVDQILYVEQSVRMNISNIVFMGMGEPLLNYENVIAACELVRHEKGIAISPRRIVISTAGVVPQIVRLADDGHRYRLAISLNASHDEQRQALMPLARTYTMGEVLNAARYYYRKTRRRPTFEYVLISGCNDSIADAQRLRAYLQAVPCKVNLIPYNPVRGGYARPSAERIEQFREHLSPLQAPVIVRWSKGDDIGAACGQLAGSRGTWVENGRSS